MVTSSMSSRLKAGLANALLVTISVLVTYAVAELVFFRIALPYMSLSLLPHIPDRAAFFLQGSKSEYVPRDYIALLGDSNAQGMGDWLLDTGGDRSKPHHSADVLHQLLHTDVVSLGRAASGSAEAMVLRITRIFGDDYCYLFPRIENPKRMLIYFSESNDIDDNYELLDHQIRPDGSDLGRQIDHFLESQYGVVSGWRCHGHFGDTIFRMARYLIKYRNYTVQILDQPAAQQVIVNGRPLGAWHLSVPSLALSDDQIDASVLVFDRSLAWLRRRFPDVPMTLVYVPSPAAIYRHAAAEVISHDIYVPITDASQVGNEALLEGRVFPVAAVYANSQKICEKIRDVSVAQGIGFIDTRPAFRAAAAERPLHGPRDWNHLNENGYRVLGSYLADRIGTPGAGRCNDQWAAKDQGTIGGTSIRPN
jgi:hypothetical protein